MNNDLISREALEKAFATDTQHIRDWDVDLYDLLMLEIEEAPAVDAVEVVRCKDCRYGEDFGEECFCHYCGSDWNLPDHYCSYGERRENNG